MNSFNMRHLVAGTCAAAFLLVAGGASAEEKLSAKAQFCEDFDKSVIMGGKVDEASKYLTDDFKEHNLRLTANGLPEFVEKMKAMRAAMAARPAGAGAGGGAGGGARPAGAAPERTVLTEGDVVVFMTQNPERDNPANPGQKIPAGTHFDVYKFRNGKISEHWD